MDANMIGAYGPWAAGLVGEGPARMSFRQARFQAAELNVEIDLRPHRRLVLGGFVHD